MKYKYDHIFVNFSLSGINHRAHTHFIRRCCNIKIHNTSDYTAALYRYASLSWLWNILFYHISIAKFSAPENNQAMTPKGSNHQQTFMDRNDIRVCCCPYSDLIKSTVQILKSKHCFCKSRILCTYWLSGRAGGENIWLEVRAYGPSAARSVPPDREPNIFPSGPTLLSQ